MEGNVGAGGAATFGVTGPIVISEKAAVAP